MKPQKNLALIALAVMSLLLAGGNAFATDATVGAIGIVGFTNPETGVFNGLRHARVELCDDDGFGVCSVFATGETSEGGDFSLRGTAGDWFWDLPEVEVRVYSTSPGVEVSNGLSVYCFKSRTEQNVVNGRTIHFGIVSPQWATKCTSGDPASGENGAWAVFQWSSEAFDFLRGTAMPTVFSGLAGVPGRGVSQQKVKWPADVTQIHGDFSGFDVKAGDEQKAGTVMTPYTIVAMTRALGATQPGPNDFDGYFAHAFAAMMARQLSHGEGRLCSTTDPNYCGTPERPPHTVHAVGGMSTGMSSIGVYWDLYDPADGENHDGNFSADWLQLTLDTIWSVMRDHNPGDPNHNHPTNITEYGEGLIVRMPSEMTHIRWIFDENHLLQP